MKRLLILALCATLSIGVLAGCGVKTESSDRKQAKATETALAEAQRQIGMPNVKNFQQRKQMKWIYELADKADLITYTYIKVEMTGQFIFVGKSLGFGVPFSAQFTNPEKIVQGDKELGYDLSGYINYPMKKPQADPNGLFMPTSSSATWVIMIDPATGKPAPQYWEPEIVVSPFPMSIALGTETVKLPPGYESENDWGNKRG